MSKRPKSAYRSNQSSQSTTDINEIFIEACAAGDYQTVNIILVSIKDFNIDVTDSLGRTALRLAVVNENLEVVAALLTKTDSQKLREALLLAIYIGHTQIAELILRHPQYKIFNDKKLLNGASDSFWQTPSSDDAQFSPDITPIMLASQYNRTEIVQMLLLNGDRIDKPHEFNCKCNECTNRFKFDSLRHAQSRLNAYRALASESYISLVSIDPVLTAFEMGHELRYLSEKEKYFKSEYLALAEKLSEYTVKLLNNVRGRDELEIVLNKTGKENEEKYERFARLDLAIKYCEMPFVAHPNCQQKLVEIWYSGIRKITKMNPSLSMLAYAGFILCLPFLSVCHIVMPNSKLGQFMVQPCIKFIAYLTSYLVFIGLVVISSLRFPNDDLTSLQFSVAYPKRYANMTNYVTNDNFKYRFQVDDFFVRDYTPNVIDCCICIWILALMFYELKKLISNGVRNYLLSVSNLVNVMTYFIYGVSFALKFYTIILVTIAIAEIDSDAFWNQVNTLSPDDVGTQIQVFKTFYWLNSDRYYWFSLDPINLSEAFYAIGSVLAFCKLCFFLPANQTLGPLQITLGRMINDILKFIFIFMIIFVGFLFGLNNLYWYYNSGVREQVEVGVDGVERHVNPENNNSTYVNAELYFGSIDLTLKTMFFSVFLIGNYNAVLISPFQNNLTVVFGYIVFGLFHVSNITVLLNMLIAMMTRSYETILHHSDTEWKFSRSQLYMDFIKEEAILPVPFNLLPMPYSIAAMAKQAWNFVLRRGGNSDGNNHNNNNNNDIEMPQMKRNGGVNGSIKANKSNDGRELTYRKVMERVVKRFLLHNSREDDEAKESDFDEFKQDVQIARVEMLSDMKRSRESMLKYTMLMHTGIWVLGDLVFNDDDHHHQHHSTAASVAAGDTTPSPNLVDEFRRFKEYDEQLKTEMQISMQSNALALRNQTVFINPTNTSTPTAPALLAPSATTTTTSASLNGDYKITITDSDDEKEKSATGGQKHTSNMVTFTDLNAISEEGSSIREN